jgi:hypothetical protein
MHLNCFNILILNEKMFFGEYNRLLDNEQIVVPWVWFYMGGRPRRGKNQLKQIFHF